MRRVIWPIVAGAVAVWLAFSAPERPQTTPVTAETPAPIGRPVALLIDDGRRVIGGQGGSVRIVEGDASPTTEWVAHGGPVRRIIDVDDDLITVGDGSVARWSRSGERRWRLRLQEHTLNDVALLDPDRETPAVFVGADRGSVARLGDDGWHRRGAHGRATFAVVALGDGIVSGGADGSVVRWTSDGREVLRWRATKGWVTALAVIGDELLVGDDGGRVTRWLLAEDAPRPRWQHALGRGAIVGLSVGHGVVLAGTEEGAAFLVDGDGARALIEPEAGAAPLSALTVRGDRAYVMQADRLRVWDLSGGRPIAEP